jgi:hypothetical protein
MNRLGWGVALATIVLATNATADNPFGEADKICYATLDKKFDRDDYYCWLASAEKACHCDHKEGLAKPVVWPMTTKAAPGINLEPPQRNRGFESRRDLSTTPPATKP